MFQLILGIGLGLFALGGLEQHLPGGHELLPHDVKAVMLGAFFALAALPTKWAILPRALLVLPSFLVFLDILENRAPPMPFGAAFFCAGCAVLFVIAYSTYLAATTQKVASRNG